MPSEQEMQVTVELHANDTLPPPGETAALPDPEKIDVAILGGGMVVSWDVICDTEYAGGHFTSVHQLSNCGPDFVLHLAARCTQRLDQFVG